MAALFGHGPMSDLSLNALMHGQTHFGFEQKGFRLIRAHAGKELLEAVADG